LVVFVLAELRWPILERIPVAGDFTISPHGIMVAVGFLLGAQVMLNRAQKRGVARRSVAGIDLHVQSILTWAAVGAIIGARFFYIVTRLDEFPNPLGWFRIWEGGLSLLGGIAGAVLAGVPYVMRKRFSVPLMLDSVAPGLALGIFVGRIGDLIIGEHLGGETTFALGWRCTGAFRDAGAPHPFTGPVPQGCFDAVVHQTALYDFLAGGIVFGLLLLLERKPRFDGFFMLAFAVLYGTGRFITDFAREADKDLIGTLTGSQLTSLATIAIVLVWVVLRRPHRRTPYAWTPPNFAHGWGTAPAADDGPVDPGEQAESGTSAEGYPSSDGAR
jgi:phosphatidylglycerol:prolipoprotein diacylglycerol transferase